SSSTSGSMVLSGSDVPHRAWESFGGSMSSVQVRAGRGLCSGRKQPIPSRAPTAVRIDSDCEPDPSLEHPARPRPYRLLLRPYDRDRSCQREPETIKLKSAQTI